MGLIGFSENHSEKNKSTFNPTVISLTRIFLAKSGFTGLPTRIAQINAEFPNIPMVAYNTTKYGSQI